MNRYSYVGLDPSNAVDPTGLTRYGLNLNFKVALGKFGFRVAVNVNYDDTANELGGSLTGGYHVGAVLEGKAEVYAEPSSELGNQFEAKGEIGAKAGGEVETAAVLSGEFTAEANAEAGWSSEKGWNADANADTTSEGSIGPTAVDAETGRFSVSLSGGAGVSAGADVTVKGNVVLPDSTESPTPPPPAKCPSHPYPC